MTTARSAIGLCAYCWTRPQSRGEPRRRTRSWCRRSSRPWKPGRSAKPSSSTGFGCGSLRLSRHLGLAEAVGVVGAELGEGLVGRAVVVGAGGGDKVELGAELEQVLGLLLGVGRVVGLD